MERSVEEGRTTERKGVQEKKCRGSRNKRKKGKWSMGRSVEERGTARKKGEQGKKYLGRRNRSKERGAVGEV